MAKAQQALTQEIGFGGVKSPMGRFMEEYLPDLQGVKWLETVDKMRRSDGLISAIEQAITLPVLSASWRVDPASDSASAVEAAEMVESNLFGGMSISWADLLRQAVLSLWYGFMFAEKVFERRDGRLAWAKIAPRKPHSLFRWFLSDTGDIEGIQQRGWSPSGWRSADVPADRLVVFTYRGEFGNHAGFPLMRPAYKHWLMADDAYRKFNLGMDKALIPTIVGKYPPSATETQKAEYESSLARWYATHGAYFMLPQAPGSSVTGGTGWDLDMLRPDTSWMGVLEYIQHHRREAARSVLAQFMTLGDGSTGSWALSSDSSDMFLMSLNATTEYLSTTFNHQAIQQLCRFNFGAGFTEYPKLAASAITGVDVKALAAALEAFTISGVITPGVHDEEAMRAVMNLPTIPKEQVEAREEQERKAVEEPAEPDEEQPSRMDAIQASRERRQARKAAGNGEGE